MHRIDNFKKNAIFSIFLSFILIYVFPYFYIEINNISSLSFFGAIPIDRKELLIIVLLNMLYSIYLCFLYKEIDYKPKFKNNNRKKIISFYCYSVVLCVIISLSHGNIVSYFFNFILLSTLALSRVKFPHIINILFILGLLDFIFHGGRWIICNSLFLYIIYYSKSMFKVTVYSTILLFFSIFILLPLRHDNAITISSDSLATFFDLLFLSINPILIGAILSFKTVVHNIDLLADYLPYGKSLLGSMSYLDKISYEYLQSDKYAENVRLGSNTSFMFKSNLAIQASLLLSIFFLLVKISKKIMLSYSNLIFIYLSSTIIMLPRRAITSYINDIIMLSIVFFLLYLIYFLIPKKKCYHNEKLIS